MLTWNEVPKSNGRHGDETEVEPVEERPVVFPDHEQPSTCCQVHEQKADGT